MKLILHIGMGKTGSSAIQKALRQSGPLLAQANASYLGMWFDFIDPAYDGLESLDRFFSQSPEEMRWVGHKLVEHLDKISSESGANTFIVSNEALSGQAYALKPMLDVLADAGVELKIVGFVRDPYAWLPSAYIQWGVRDKVEPGEVKPYGIRARQLVLWYEGLLGWARLFGESTSIGQYEEAGDVVSAFSKLIGLPLVDLGERVLERGEDAEIILRAIFNGQFSQHVLPDEFDTGVMPAVDEIENLDSMVLRCLDFSDTENIISENSDLFVSLQRELGFDVVKRERRVTPVPDAETVRRRIVDVLIALVLRQCRENRRLEERVCRIEKRLGTIDVER